MSDRVLLTARCEALLERVRARRGPLTMVLGSGCCDGGSPFLFENYPPPANHRQVANLSGIPVWVDEGLWAGQDLDLTIDAVEDPAADSFSAESELGYRLVLA
ncbi:MAG: DUF779 domain-containing protein [Candidatus Dormibacteria bacterium]